MLNGIADAVVGMAEDAINSLVDVLTDPMKFLQSVLEGMQAMVKELLDADDLMDIVGALEEDLAEFLWSHFLDGTDDHDGVGDYTNAAKGEKAGRFVVVLALMAAGAGATKAIDKLGDVIKAAKKGKRGGHMPDAHKEIVEKREALRADRRNACGSEEAGQNPQGSKKEKGQKGPAGVSPKDQRKAKAEKTSESATSESMKNIAAEQRTIRVPAQGRGVSYYG